MLGKGEQQDSLLQVYHMRELNKATNITEIMAFAAAFSYGAASILPTLISMLGLQIQKLQSFFSKLLRLLRR